MKKITLLLLAYSCWFFGLFGNAMCIRFYNIDNYNVNVLTIQDDGLCL